MIHFDQNTNPQLSTEALKFIHSIELKKPTMIYTSSHIDKLLNNFKDLLLKHCGIYSYGDDHPSMPSATMMSKKQYSLYITSGNAESNKNLVYATISSFKRITKRKPHIIICETDNSALLKYLNQLKINGEVDIDMVSINIQGCSVSKIIEKSIKVGRTCLIIVGFVNSVFGSVNHITKIGELAHTHKIPIHVNCNYIFGNLKINPHENNIDSFVMDFSNIGGVKNIGILGIKKELLDGYQLDKSVHEFKPTASSSGIDPISLEMANNTLATVYANKKVKLGKVKRIYNMLVKELKKKYDVVPLMEYLKTNREVASSKANDALTKTTATKSKDTLVVLFLQNSSATNGLHSMLSILPVDFDELSKKRLASIAAFDKVDRVAIYHYKTVFKELFKKNNCNIELFNNLLALSWDDKITSKQINTFVKNI